MAAFYVNLCQRRAVAGLPGEAFVIRATLDLSYHISMSHTKAGAGAAFIEPPPHDRVRQTLWA